MTHQVSPGQPNLVKSSPIFWLALGFSLFQIWMAAFSPLTSQVVRALHVGFVLSLIFFLYPFSPSAKIGQIPSRLGFYLSVGLGLIGFGTGLYQWHFESDLTQRAGELTLADKYIGIALIIMVFEAARRVMGWSLPLVCGGFLLYGMFGQYLPAGLAHRGYDSEQIIGLLGFGTDGIYGTPTYVSSTYIFLFILFGAFLEQAGMIGLFNDLAMGTVGHAKGGPAKVAVISSGLMGTINGSGVANVVTTGQFTIPLMKKFGYSSSFAGGVEATASMGGQIMPPVMGAVAFIMAETINVPYIEIAKAALIPAILYYGSTFWIVHLEAGKRGLVGLAKEDCPNPWSAIQQKYYLLLPLAGLVWLLFAGYTPLFAGSVGLALTVILILGAVLLDKSLSLGLRLVGWMLIGLAGAGFVKFGMGALLVLVLVLLILTVILKKGRDTRSLILRSLVEGARHALPVAIACALVGVIIGIINLTGVAASLGGEIIAIGKNNLFLALFLTMLTCLVLGMGIPTIPNYIITSSLAAPILLKLGVPLIVSHMFVFYFGIMADLTPPVALAAFAAAPIAKESGMKIGIAAVRIALAGFVIPFMAVYSPALMLQHADPIAVVWIIFKTTLAIGLWGATTIGYFWQKLTWWERLLALLSAGLLVVAYPLTDEIGLALATLFIMWQFYKLKGGKFA